MFVRNSSIILICRREIFRSPYLPSAEISPSAPILPRLGSGLTIPLPVPNYWHFYWLLLSVRKVCRRRAGERFGVLGRRKCRQDAGHPGKFPTLPAAKSTIGPARQTFRTDTEYIPTLSPLPGKSLIHINDNAAAWGKIARPRNRDCAKDTTLSALLPRQTVTLARSV